MFAPPINKPVDPRSASRAKRPVPFSLPGAGAPLAAAIRQKMEQSFGADFSHVRVHADARAEESASKLAAHAYTVESDLVFGKGQYAPETPAGQRLLAHELAHVVQQDPSRTSVFGRSPASASHETEADLAAADVVAGRPGRVYRGTASPSVQLFGSAEHQSLGDTATGGTLVNVGGTTPGTRLELTQGDVIALSGDYFNPDDLMRLGALPGNNGQLAGTRDEIIFVLHEIRPSDRRFQPGGSWHGYLFSNPVRNAVNTRYQALAAVNTSHFVAPRGYSATGTPNQPVGNEGSAGTNYRAIHERAIRMAYVAGRATGGDSGQAMAMEAAGQHFLTDAFSAGHLRTPIGSIRDYWRNLYPLFWYNLLHKMALDTAVRLNAQVTNLTTVVGTVQDMYEAIISAVNAIASSLPQVTLGDVVAKVFHDYDNEHGLAIAGGGMIYGDSHLDDPNPLNRTRTLAQGAIQAGNRDILEAFRLGRLGASAAAIADADLLLSVRTASGAPAGAYLAESRIPRPDSAAPAQNWQATDFETLWNRSMLGGSGPTVGSQIIRAMGPGTEIRGQLEGLASSFDPVDPRWSGNLQPQQAYLDGFLRPLMANPYAGILAIIHWAPNYGLRSADRDDISLASGQELDSSQRLAGMTSLARSRYIRELISGSVAGDEEDLVARIFETAPARERARVYQMVEGHAWTGNWIQGWTISDDNLWNALDSAHLSRVRTAINAGWP